MFVRVLYFRGDVFIKEFAGVAKTAKAFVEGLEPYNHNPKGLNKFVVIEEINLKDKTGIKAPKRKTAKRKKETDGGK